MLMPCPGLRLRGMAIRPVQALPASESPNNISAD
jgi:hypothetical protein